MLSSDTDVFYISSKGVINPKRAGVAYAAAYTKTSGLHKGIKVTVIDKVFISGIYTYSVNNYWSKLLQ
jgi:hypothetical protein